MPSARPIASCGRTGSNAPVASKAVSRLSANIHGWLLLLPAAVLLVAFTHYPAAATLLHSFFSTPKGDRPAIWVGLDNYQAMVEDPVFWQAFTNNLWFALGTIPASIALAMLMAVWVNGKLHGRARLSQKSRIACRRGSNVNNTRNGPPCAARSSFIVWYLDEWPDRPTGDRERDRERQEERVERS